jgi:hypothetical protein
MGRFAALLFAVLFARAGDAGALDITACDQEVRAREVGVLTTDLNCGWSTDEGYAVELGDRAVLDLNGHTITGPRYGVFCERRCSVVGPGTITGAYYGIWALESKQSRADVTDVALVGNLGGMATPKGTLTNVTATDNILGLHVHKLRGTNLTVSGCSDVSAYCIETDVGTVDGLTATGNHSSIALFLVTKKLTLTNGTVKDNAAPIGILSLGRLTLEGSEVIGHGTDLTTLRRPRVESSTCVTSSALIFPHPAWGVCAND